MEQLRSLLARRGVHLSAAVLGSALASGAVSAAPAGLVATISGIALTTAAVGSGTPFALLKSIAMTKLKLGIFSAIVIAGVVTPLALRHQAQAGLREKDNALLRQGVRIAQLEAENERLSKAAVEARNLPDLTSEQFHELARLRGQVGVLRQQTHEHARLQQENRKLLAQMRAHADTNQLSAQDLFTLQQTHAVDTMQTLLAAVKNYAANHNGEYPGSLDQVAASGEVGASNFPGNLKLNDFEYFKAGALDPLSNKFLLRLRVPLRKPGGPSATVTGTLADDDVPRTTVWNASP